MKGPSPFPPGVRLRVSEEGSEYALAHGAKGKFRYNTPAMSQTLEVEFQLLEVHGGAIQAGTGPGLLARPAPRRCARGREADFLFLAVALSTREHVNPDRLEELADLAARAYFGTPGSVTSAQRAAAEALNTRLLEYNVRGASIGSHMQAGSAMAVLRGLDIYLGQCGEALTLVTHPAMVERFPAGEPRARPLGISQTVNLQYYHAQAAPDDLLVLTAAAPPGWAAADFQELAGSPLEQAFRQLEIASHTSESGFSFMAARFGRAGTTPTPGRSQTPPSRTPPLTKLHGREVAALPHPPPATPPPTRRPSQDDPARGGGGRPRQGHLAEKPRQKSEGVVAEEKINEPRPGWRERVGRLNPGRALRAVLRAVGVTLAESYRGARIFVARLLPAGTLEREGLFTLPASLLLALAVAIPVVVVAVVTVVYFQRGRTEQYQLYLDQAESEISMARTQPDLLQARPHYEAALLALEKAQAYARTDQTVALVLEAQGALDQLDGITRLDYRPAVPGGFGSEARLTALAVGQRNLYALDTAANAVRLARPNAIAFDYDNSFSCSPQGITNLTMGTLVDLAWLPGRNVLTEDGALIVLDRNGSLMYCAPDVTPLASRLTEPEIGWARPTAMDLFADRLYVLDPGANEIWAYESSSGVFNQRPSRYFTSVSYDLSDVVDFAIAQGELFLLHADGTLTGCTRGGVEEAAECGEGLFVDSRQGRSDGRAIDGAVPSRIIYDPPPEPSLYFVDTLAGGIYQHSLRLVFQRQFRPLNGVPDGRVEAVTIGPNKEVFIAVGDNVYFSGR